jgi:hypothetical protein
MGDFPVRKIASMKSFSHLIRIKHTQRPSAIVIDAREDGFSIESAEDVILNQLPTCPRIYLVLVSYAPSNLICPICPFSSVYVISENTTSLAFSKHIQNLLPERGAQKQAILKNSLLAYRDLRLDMDYFQLQILPQEKMEVLPLKEARLLRYFMENAGKCLSREEIQRAVWDGVKIESRTIDSHISRLRKRIGTGEVTIESLYGNGYQMT